MPTKLPMPPISDPPGRSAPRARPRCRRAPPGRGRSASPARHRREECHLVPVGHCGDRGVRRPGSPPPGRSTARQRPPAPPHRVPAASRPGPPRSRCRPAAPRVSSRPAHPLPQPGEIQRRGPSGPGRDRLHAAVRADQRAGPVAVRHQDAAAARRRRVAAGDSRGRCPARSRPRTDRSRVFTVGEVKLAGGGGGRTGGGRPRSALLARLTAGFGPGCRPVAPVAAADLLRSAASQGPARSGPA